MVIPEVPQSVPRSKVVEFFTELGIDPKWCAGIELQHRGIYADVFVRDDHGGKLVTQSEPAIHKVFIPFT